MNSQQFREILRKNKLVNVIKEEKHIDKIKETPSQVVFLLTGNIANLKNYVDYLKGLNKIVFIHVEMIGGLNCDKDGLAFISNCIKPHGIISTRKKIIQLAKRYKLLTVQRIFVIDSDAVSQSIENIQSAKPDVIEIMPARMPEMITYIDDAVSMPVIAGGLIKKREHIEEALAAGAIAVASGTPKIWKEKVAVNKKGTVLFDLDGTLLDSRKSVIDAVYYISNKYRPGLFTYEEIEARFGESLDEFIDLLDEDNKDAIYEDYMTYIITHHDESVDLFPNIYESIKQLKYKGFKVALTTNKQRHLTLKALDLFDIGNLFDAVVCVEDVTKGKPSPEMLLMACNQLSSDIDDAVLVGDTVLDVQAAHAAGMDSVVLDWYDSYHLRENPPQPKYYYKHINGFVEDLFG